MNLLVEFFDLTRSDARISPTHVSLYAVIFSLWSDAGCKNPVSVDRTELMLKAKISGRGTFYKCIRELQQFGFIKYVPSVNQFLESLVFLMDPDEKMSKY